MKNDKATQVYYIIPSYYHPKDKLNTQNINVINLINSKDLKSKNQILLDFLSCKSKIWKCKNTAINHPRIFFFFLLSVQVLSTRFLGGVRLGSIVHVPLALLRLLI